MPNFQLEEIQIFLVINSTYKSYVEKLELQDENSCAQDTSSFNEKKFDFNIHL